MEGERSVPAGWWLLFGGLIAFGVYYLWAYTPWLGGWSQGGALAQAGEAAADGGGGNILATILFTALAVITAGVLLLALSRRKKQP